MEKKWSMRLLSVGLSTALTLSMASVAMAADMGGGVAAAAGNEIVELNADETLGGLRLGGKDDAGNMSLPRLRQEEAMDTAKRGYDETVTAYYVTIPGDTVTFTAWDSSGAAENAITWAVSNDEEASVSETKTGNLSTVNFTLKEGKSSGTLTVKNGETGKVYTISITKADVLPEAVVSYGVSNGGTGKASITAKNMHASTLEVAVQCAVDGAEINRGITDESGAAALAIQGDYTWFDVLGNKAYKVTDGKESLIKDGISGSLGAVSEGAVVNGWTPYTVTYRPDGKTEDVTQTLFEVNTEKVMLDQVKYYPNGTFYVSFSANITVDASNDVVQMLSCDAAGTELFRFFYGLQDGKDSVDMDLSATATQAGDFTVSGLDSTLNRVVDVMGAVEEITTLDVVPADRIVFYLDMPQKLLEREGMTYIVNELTADSKLGDAIPGMNGTLKDTQVKMVFGKGGTYRMVLNGDGYLPVALHVVVPEIPADAASQKLFVGKVGALTGGNIETDSTPLAITLADKSAIVPYLGHQIGAVENGDMNIPVYADFDFSGRVDVLDLAVVLENMGKKSNSAPVGEGTDAVYSNADITVDFAGGSNP